jgi:predicted HTH domain antitoxin
MCGIDVPTEVYEALEVPEDERDGILRRERAVSRYREDYLSFGTARELAGLSKAEFHRLLGRRSVGASLRQRPTGEESSTVLVDPRTELVEILCSSLLCDAP